MSLVDENRQKVRVVVIDSGIDSSVSTLKHNIIKSTGFWVNSVGLIGEVSNKQINSLHGTSVALVIKDICNNVEFVSFNILNERLKTDSRIMIYAMNEALREKPNIIHLSLGTSNWRYYFYIKKIVNEAKKNNIIIVAAYNNKGIFPSYPASIRGVVGVKSLFNNSGKNFFYYKYGRYYAPNSLNEIEGSSELINAVEIKGTSISAAYITGHIANVIFNQDIHNYNDILKSLKTRT